MKNKSIFCLCYTMQLNAVVCKLLKLSLSSTVVSNRDMRITTKAISLLFHIFLFLANTETMSPNTDPSG